MKIELHKIPIKEVLKDYKDSAEEGVIAYAWFVWDKEYEGKPTIEWIPS